MASYNPADLRFIGLIKQPDDSDPSNLDFDESDVVWSFFPSPGSYSNSPSPPSVHRRRRKLNHRQSGLSAALDNGQRHMIGRKSMAIPAAARSENVPDNFHRSAPVNVPVWPKAFRGSDDLENFDEVDEEDEEENGEMVPPHVIVSRSHVTFSVFEGVGRTLKGRDLRRVRNAVFQNTDSYAENDTQRYV